MRKKSRLPSLTIAAAHSLAVIQIWLAFNEFRIWIEENVQPFRHCRFQAQLYTELGLRSLRPLDLALLELS